MSLNRYEFEVLNYVIKMGTNDFSLRKIANTICVSVMEVQRSIESLRLKRFIALEPNRIILLEDGRKELEAYRVKRAIILAAGFGSRMMPATETKPKPMVTVNNVRIIDTLLDALTAIGIQEIIIVGGYKFERLKELRDKYPNLILLENKDYATTNNISSAITALEYLVDGCYFCEADLYISNPEILAKYHYSSNILGSYSLETDDWSYKMKDGCVSDYQKGNTFCYNYYGISYWTAEDCEKLKKDFWDVYHSPDGKDFFWEFIPFVLKKEHYKVEIRPCRKQDIMEIDNYYELAQLDSKY